MADNLEQPLSTDPHLVVENIYLVPGQAPEADPVVQDLPSWRGMTDFLWDRMRRDPDPFAGGVMTIPTGEEEYKTRLPRFDRWNWWLGNDRDDSHTHTRRAVGLFMAANLLLNLVNGNAVSAIKDTVEGTQIVKDHVEDWLGIGMRTETVTTHVREPHTVTKTITERLSFNSSGENQPVGEAVVDQQIVDKILNRIAAREQQGQKLTVAEFKGVASDDWRSDPVSNGLGHPNLGENDILAKKRLLLTTQKLLEEAKARGIDLSGATFSAHEAVLSEEDVLAVENAILSNGFDNYDTTDKAVDAALQQYKDNPASLSKHLRHILHERLPRGFETALTFTHTEKVPGKDIIRTEHHKERHHDGSPENKNHDYDWAFLPLILAPLPEFRRMMRERATFEDITIPPYLPDPEYFKLYPAARTEENTLIDQAWAYARKYQHMMRETDRVQGMYRLDYEDGQGEPQRLRAMFIDHQPTPDTLERVANLLQTISQMQDGRVGKELDMIAIYPSENAGIGHDNPKMIGLGQDIQFEDSTLGVAYPSLRLAELHMPPTTTRDNMGNYNSPDWVLAHEVGGHFTDLDNEQNELRATGHRLPNGAEVFTTNGRFEGFMQDNYDNAATEEQSGRPSRWRAHRTLRNARGEMVDLEHDIIDPAREPSRWRVVNAVHRAIHAVRNPHGGSLVAGDPRLAESWMISKETGHPTRYGATNAMEHEAEAAASELVGPIPFEQAHDGQRIITQPGFAQGYHVARRDRQALAGRWGSDVSQPGVVFTDDQGQPRIRPDWNHWYGRPADDEELAALMNEARTTSLPDDSDLLHIITGRRI